MMIKQKIKDVKEWALKTFEKTKDHRMLYAFAITRVPLLAFIGPRIMECNDESTILKVYLCKRNRNHLKKKTMYFGALCIGAEAAAGYRAMKEIIQKKYNIELVFESFKADFIKKAQNDILFVCNNNKEILEMIEKASHQSNRLSLPVQCTAIDADSHETCAHFELQLSLKNKKYH